jgi:hypothetical protein
MEGPLMAEVTLQLEDGGEMTYKSKKAMLKGVGRSILAGSDEPMTLRQLYYRFVALDLIENKRSQYQYLSEAIKEARLSGLIPWDWIEDRTRSTDGGDFDHVTPESRFDGNLDWFKKTPNRYHLPKWLGQDNYVEVWVEKEALAGVFANVCEDLRVVTFPSRGYTSITLLKEAAERMEGRDDRDLHILYFGDFDPSGQDIERNIRDKLNGTFGVPVEVERKALTRAQIDRYELPPQPAKSSDSRYDDFVSEHGNMAVELDALPPDELRRLIRESVREYFDQDHYENEVLPKQRAHRERLRGMISGVLDE